MALVARLHPVANRGENNCGGTVGNSAEGVGYGCQLPAMVAEWRQIWSSTPGTTSSQAPFGVVTLAAGGSEGHDENMAGMRWSQTGNYGKLPSAAIPNGFLAHAYDLGDPMDNLRAPCVNTSSGAMNATAFGPGGPCTWPAAEKWNDKIRDLRPAVFENAAPSFMGGVICLPPSLPCLCPLHDLPLRSLPLPVSCPPRRALSDGPALTLTPNRDELLPRCSTPHISFIHSFISIRRSPTPHNALDASQGYTRASSARWVGGSPLL